MIFCNNNVAHRQVYRLLEGRLWLKTETSVLPTVPQQLPNSATIPPQECHSHCPTVQQSLPNSGKATAQQWQNHCPTVPHPLPNLEHCFISENWMNLTSMFELQQEVASWCSTRRRRLLQGRRPSPLRTTSSMRPTPRARTTITLATSTTTSYRRLRKW